MLNQMDLTKKRSRSTRRFAVPEAPTMTLKKTLEPTGSSTQLSQAWSRVGFFDATPSLDTIRGIKQMPQAQLSDYSAQQSNRKRRDSMWDKYSRLQSMPGPTYKVEIGDVYETTPDNTIPGSVMKLYRVIEVDNKLRFAMLKGNTGTVRIYFRDLMNPVKYRRIISEGRQPSPHYGSLPALPTAGSNKEITKYFDNEGKTSIYETFRHGQEERFTHAEDPSAITPRLAYVRACRKRQLPPLPLISKCTNDKYPMLDLSNQSCGKSFCEALAEALPSMTFLRGLNFNNNRIDSLSAVTILNSLRKTKIECLMLEKNKIGRSGVQALQNLIIGAERPPQASPVVESRPRRNSAASIVLFVPNADALLLTRLSLADNNIGDSTIAKLVTCIEKYCRTMVDLNLSGNDCSTFTAAAVTSLVSSSTSANLRDINLSWNNIATAGAVKILSALVGNTTLHVLNLDWNGLSEDIVPLLEDIADRNTTLQRISIIGNQIAHKSLDTDIQRRRESLTIVVGRTSE